LLTDARLSRVVVECFRSMVMLIIGTTEVMDHATGSRTMLVVVGAMSKRRCFNSLPTRLNDDDNDDDMACVCGWSKRCGDCGWCGG